MRASGACGRHISGAERIVIEREVSEVGAELLARAVRRGETSSVRVTVERRAASEVHSIPCLTVVNGRPGINELRRIAEEAGIDPGLFDWAVSAVRSGAAPEGGAALVDADGARRDPNASRGVRARHFDYTPGARGEARTALEAAGLGHFRTFEALALASKVSWAGVALEVCWSDEPDYLTGYIATAEHGYVRVPDWKPQGAPGGRVFFLRPDLDPVECTRRLEEEWTLIDGPIVVKSDV